MKLLIEWRGWRLSFGHSDDEPPAAPLDPGTVTSYPVPAGEPDEDTSPFGLR